MLWSQKATDENVIWLMRVACRITKARNTHSIYVLLIAFPRQQWLHELGSILLCTFIACFVVDMSCTDFFFLYRTKSIENTYRFLFMLPSKVWLSLHPHFQQNYSYWMELGGDYLTEFHVHWSRSTDSTCRSVYTPFSKVWVSLRLLARYSTVAWQLLIKSSYTEFNENLINDLITVARSQMDMWTDVLFHKRRSFLLHKQETGWFGSYYVVTGVWTRTVVP